MRRVFSIQVCLAWLALLTLAMPAPIHPDGSLLFSGDMAREFRQNHSASFSGAQTFKRLMSALVNEGITLIKDSSLVSAIGLAELALAACTVAGAYSRYWEPYLAISAVYLVLTLTLSLLAKRLKTPAHLRGC